MLRVIQPLAKDEKTVYPCKPFFTNMSLDRHIVRAKRFKNPNFFNIQMQISK